LTLSTRPSPSLAPALTPFPADHPDRFLRRREVEHLVGMKKTSIYAQMAAGTFPRSIAITPRCVAWSERAVHVGQLAGSSGCRGICA
jgi:predicted DNA-binding transcriptional regulator AlpA